MVALMVDEDLRLIVETAEGGGVENAVPITRVRLADGAGAFGKSAASSLTKIRSIGRKNGPASGHLGKRRFVPIPISTWPTD